MRAWQRRQAERASRGVPGVHRVHWALPEKLGPYVPAAQGVQVVAPGWAYVPTLQTAEQVNVSVSMHEECCVSPSTSRCACRQVCFAISLSCTAGLAGTERAVRDHNTQQTKRMPPA